LQEQRLPNSFEDLNSSLVQLLAEIFPRKNTSKLLDFSLSLLEWKVLIPFFFNLILVAAGRSQKAASCRDGCGECSCPRSTKAIHSMVVD